MSLSADQSLSMHAPGNDLDVAIVGYGPVGAVLANLLGASGLTVGVFEREVDIYHQPRAGHFDGEVMRIFQSIGLADAIARQALVNPGMQFVNAEGKLLLDWPRPLEIGPDGWHSSYRFHQPYLEQSLRYGAGRYSNVKVHLRADVFAIEQHGGSVRLRYEDLRSGELKKTSASYVVGCDGARSLVRRLMGSPVEDLKSHERWLVVDMVLSRPRPDLPAVTVQICDPARPTTVIRMVENRRRWEFMLMPGDDPAKIARSDSVWRLLAPWVTPEEGEIERAVVYTFHSALVNGWRNGRLLAAGDACHQTPPFMGQGMCAGIRDVANLAWKMSAVVSGHADETLLDTYETERSTHTRTYIDTAVSLGSVIQTTEPELVERRDAELAAMPKKMKSLRLRLGEGLHFGPWPSGTLCRQLLLSTNARLDDVLGAGFGLLVHSTFLERSARTLAKALLPVETHVLLDPEIDGYLQELSTSALIVRPDRYILGVAGSIDELSALAGKLAPYWSKRGSTQRQVRLS